MNTNTTKNGGGQARPRSLSGMARRDFLAGSLAAGLGVGVSCALPLRANAAPEGTAQGTGAHVLILTGSPRENGNTNTLARYFARGAEDAGHTVFRFDCAKASVRPCNGCNACHMDGPCIYRDDFEKHVRPNMEKASVVVFVSPFYYYGFTAQLKKTIDRFYAINRDVHRPRRAALLAAYANSSVRRAEPLRAHYAMLLEYFGWESVGEIVVPGMWPAGAINATSWPQKAYGMGRALKA